MTLYALLMLIIIFCDSLLMETYKKVLRKNKHTNWECWIIAMILSVLSVGLLYHSDAMIFVFHNKFESKIWLDCLLYIIMFYVAQFYADMVVVKKLILSLCKTLLTTLGLTEEQKNMIIEMIEKKNKENI